MEEKIKEYIINGGKIFSIKDLTTIRDGGTKQIICLNKDQFFIHKNTNKFHYKYPPTDENLIKNELLIIYLIDVIEKYIKRQGEEYKRNTILLDKLKK